LGYEDALSFQDAINFLGNERFVPIYDEVKAFFREGQLS
jgi:hypothetical protein